MAIATQSVIFAAFDLEYELPVEEEVVVVAPPFLPPPPPASPGIENSFSLLLRSFWRLIFSSSSLFVEEEEIR